MNIISSLLIKPFCFATPSRYLIGLKRKWQVTQWENVISFKALTWTPRPYSSTQSAHITACSLHTVTVFDGKSVSSLTGVTFSYVFEIGHMDRPSKDLDSRESWHVVLVRRWWKLNLCRWPLTSRLNTCFSLKLENRYSLSWASERSYKLSYTFWKVETLINRLLSPTKLWGWHLQSWELKFRLFS